MKALAYYNEWDPYAAAWLRNLIEEGLIPYGHVDTRSIDDVRSDDLRGYCQVHFFAGIGGWPLGLRRAGWRDDWPICTGSCPCQPYSSAGKKKGKKDPRHKWPQMYRLVRESGFAVVAGEQVAGKDALHWWDGVSADLERAGYAQTAFDLCLAGIGAPHIRQRLCWVGHAQDARLPWHQHARALGVEAGPGAWMLGPGGPGEHGGRLANRHRDGRAQVRTGVSPSRLHGPGRDGAAGWMEHPGRARSHAQPGRRVEPARPAAPAHALDRMDHAVRVGWGSRREGHAGHDRQQPGTAESLHHWMGDASGAGFTLPQPALLSRAQRKQQRRAALQPGRAWSDFMLVPCSDGKWRRISAQPGDEPVAYGLPRSLGPGSARSERLELMAAKKNRVGRIKGYGNAVAPELVSLFMQAVMEHLMEVDHA